MKIAVIGSGAMGSLYGGLLAADGADVTLIDVWGEHVEALRRNGLTMETPEGTIETIPVDATTDPTGLAGIDLAVILVKGTHTRAAVENAADLLEDASVLTLQNGLGNPEQIATVVDESAVLAGVTGHGSTLVEPGYIRHAGRGQTIIGNYFVESDDRATAIADRFEEAGIETEVSTDIRRDIWEKVAVNVGINAATALARVPNGKLAEAEAGKRLLKAAVEECVLIAEAEGHEIREDIVEHVRDIAKATGSNESSMYQDIEADRPTEIETINGEVVRRGESRGIKAPVNRTLSDLVRLAEEGPYSR